MNQIPGDKSSVEGHNVRGTGQYQMRAAKKQKEI